MTEPRYPYVHVDVSSDDAELVSSELFDWGALGLEERDASTLLRPVEAGVAVTLVASFPDEASAEAAAAHFARSYSARVEHVVGDAWREGWRAYFKPLRVGSRLVVRPSWEAFAAGPDDLVLTLDPGQAFGTGTHETTQLLLAQLETYVERGMRVLDVGTGSGILGVASLLLGAREVVAIDVDPLAVDAARENAEHNGVGAQLHASLTPLSEITETFPLVLANIEARVLLPQADVLMQRVAKGGVLMLSGLLLHDAEPIRAAYASLRELACPKQGEWCALVFRRDDGS